MNEREAGKTNKQSAVEYSVHPGNRTSCKQPSVSLLQEADRMQQGKSSDSSI